MRTLPLIALLACGPDKKPADASPPVADSESPGGGDGGDGGDGDTGGGAGVDSDSASGVDSEVGADTADSEKDKLVWGDGCVVSKDLPRDPIHNDSVVDLSVDGPWGAPLLLEATDVVPRWEDERLIMVGGGGMATFDISTDPPTWLDRYRGPLFQYEDAVDLGDGRVAMTSPGLGVEIVDATDPAALSASRIIEGVNASAVAVFGTNLAVFTFDGRVLLYPDLAVDHRVAPAEFDGLGIPLAVEVVGEYAYVADSRLGVVPIDLRAPDAPLMLTPVAAAGPQGLAVSGGWLYLAQGSYGVGVFDLSDPEAPAATALVEYGAPVIGVAVAQGVLWAANQQGVAAIDVSDPAQPLQLAFEDTAEWALAVTARERTAYVTDWTRLERYTIDPTARAPSAEFNRQILYVEEAGDVAGVTMTNRGAAELEILGAQIHHPGFEIGVEVTVIPPGGSADVTFTYDGTEITEESAVCLSTTDPDIPLQRLGMGHSTVAGSLIRVGESATDFALQGIDGQVYQLSDALGDPVFLVFFATW